MDINKIVVNGTSYDIVDTKNTAGSTDTNEKLYLVGATSQGDNLQTYSQDTAYVDTDGCLYSGGDKVLTVSEVVVAPEKIGFGIGTCSTAATTAAKEVSIQNFVLTKNGHISVKFQNAISVTGATLNINSTGAKSIYYNGNPVQPGDIKAGMTANMVYDGTNYVIVSLLGLESGGTTSDLYVDMGLPSGRLWAKRNIDITQANGFAASEYQYECSFFSWGNVDGHNPTSSNSFSPYSWGNGDSSEPYASSEGAKIIYPGVAGPSHDAARTILGAPWRLPDAEDFAELLNPDYTKFIDANGDEVSADDPDKRIDMPAASGSGNVSGLRIKSKINGNVLFFPCCGYGLETNWYRYRERGMYWSRSRNSDGDRLLLHFYDREVLPMDYDDGNRGTAIRPVQ